MKIKDISFSYMMRGNNASYVSSWSPFCLARLGDVVFQSFTDCWTCGAKEVVPHCILHSTFTWMTYIRVLMWIWNRSFACKGKGTTFYMAPSNGLFLISLSIIHLRRNGTASLWFPQSAVVLDICGQYFAHLWILPTLKFLTLQCAFHPLSILPAPVITDFAGKINFFTICDTPLFDVVDSMLPTGPLWIFHKMTTSIMSIWTSLQSVFVYITVASRSENAPGSGFSCLIEGQLESQAPGSVSPGARAFRFLPWALYHR